MIGGNKVDAAIEHLAPQHGVLVWMPQRRRALRGDANSVEIVLREKQVVRTGFHRYINTACAPFSSFRDAASGADVHDMQLRTGLTSEIDGARNRVELGLHGARREKIGRGRSRGGRQCSRNLFALRVDGDWQT